MTTLETLPRRVRHAAQRASRPPRPPAGDAREQVLVYTALELLRSGVFADATIADLAAAAGISRATFYFYFASKEALLASVLDRSVQGFSDRIAGLLGAGRTADAADALTRSVQAAAQLWWDHAPVLVAGFELGARHAAVYERTQSNLAVVLEPTSALLQRVRRVPEAADPERADVLVLALMLMTERSLYHLMRGSPTLDDRRRTTEGLVAIWLRAFGLEEER
ncbi:TetR/AcrR family transcriptional regulator [uncultured Amnibacterium sp.]|uniref:TetR/AcrR family transcriptional regulator n=1 Tax=uncultured Amnibacterium sp. TaxID=1631851 RepID=UPI0035C94B6E